jgi:hypothetical protein
MAFVENISKGKFLVIMDGELKLMENNFGQTWETGEPNKEGYFAITHHASEKALTASSNQRIKIKGKF